MSEKFLPCPCCGSDDLSLSREGLLHGWQVECGNQNCRAASGVFPTRAMALKAWNRRYSPPQPEPAGVMEEQIAYVLLYGPRCYECADNDGVCPGTGLPCGDSEKAIRFVVEAIAYGQRHGFLPQARMSEAGWQPIETAPSNDGWIGPCLFGKHRSWGWESWVGQCDAGNIWLGRDGEGSCFETDKPTHWRPLPSPPQGDAR